MEWKIEVVLNNERAARVLLSLIMSDAVNEMLEKLGGEIKGSIAYDMSVEDMGDTLKLNLNERGEEEVSDAEGK